MQHSQNDMEKHFRRPVRLPMPPFGDSITFIARHRGELGSPTQLIVNISSSLRGWRPPSVRMLVYGLKCRIDMALPVSDHFINRLLGVADQVRRDYRHEEFGDLSLPGLSAT